MSRIQTTSSNERKSIKDLMNPENIEEGTLKCEIYRNPMNIRIIFAVLILSITIILILAMGYTPRFTYSLVYNRGEIRAADNFGNSSYPYEDPPSYRRHQVMPSTYRDLY